jgi:hypothetical protein
MTMARKKKEDKHAVILKKKEEQDYYIPKYKSIPDESTFENKVSLYDYSQGRSCRVDYNPYDYGFDFGNLSMDDF